MTTSFKQKIASKEIKRADAMKVRFQDLHVEPGFNLRTEGAELEASIDALAQHIIQGGQYPALEVRPRAEGGVLIVDGHRRHRAIAKALEAGAPLADKDGEVWVSIVAFEGNDADRCARIITSAEGRALTPLEIAFGYKRLAAFGWDNDRIAKTVGRTANHVGQLLQLANANSDVHRLVADGTVSAALALDAVRKHGEQAGAFLRGELTKAQAAGKAKVTAGTIKGKALPPKVVTGLVDGVDAFMGSLDKTTRECLASIEAKQNAAEGAAWEFPSRIEVSGTALLALLKAHAGVTEARDRQAARQRDASAQASQATIPDEQQLAA